MTRKRLPRIGDDYSCEFVRTVVGAALSKIDPERYPEKKAEHKP